MPGEAQVGCEERFSSTRAAIQWHRLPAEVVGPTLWKPRVDVAVAEGCDQSGRWHR